MGICDSRGVIYDFQGPYAIGEDGMAFGNPTRYLQLDPRKIDLAAARANLERARRLDGGSGGRGRGGGDLESETAPLDNLSHHRGGGGGPSSGGGGGPGGGGGGLDECVRLWDACVRQGNLEYSRRMHNIFCDNCHSHVGRCLQLMGYAARPILFADRSMI